LHSTYCYGPLGLIQRTAEQNDTCLENNCVYQYLNDATGNCTGVVCAGATGTCNSGTSTDLCGCGSSQVCFTRMDAWGVLIGPEYMGAPPPKALPSSNSNCASQPSTECGGVDPMPEEVTAGPYQYHGSQGYETDVADPLRAHDDPDMGRSTGFIHVGCRYYEPEIGRFLQSDPMPVDPTPMSWGQTNRWAYCANDPVNCTDASGLFLFPGVADFLIGLGLVLIAAAIGWWAGSNASSLSFAEGAAISALVIILGNIGWGLMTKNYAAVLAALSSLITRGLVVLLIGLMEFMGVHLTPCQRAQLLAAGKEGLLALLQLFSFW
jgi:RHS repeat-associated protein